MANTATSADGRTKHGISTLTYCVAFAPGRDRTRVRTAFVSMLYVRCHASRVRYRTRYLGS